MLLNGIKHAQALTHRIFRLLANRTGIDQYQVSDLHIASSLKPSLTKNGGYDFTIAEVHLTAVALDVEMLVARANILLKKHFPLLGFVHRFAQVFQGRIVVIHASSFCGHKDKCFD